MTPPNIRTRIMPACLCIPLIAAFHPAAHGCPIPVFQYSIEYWESDPYQITIYHSGELSGQDKQAAQLLSEAADEEKNPANIVVEFVDLAAEDNNTAQDFEELPHIEVCYPAAVRSRQPVWKGKLTPDAVKALLDSPARRRIASLLLARKSAVWVLLESGNEDKDDAAANLLEKEIARLEKTLVLPDPAAWGWSGSKDILAPVAFAMVRVSRKEPAEKALLQMLTQSEADLAEFEEEPIVFPIYGRGLILYALVGRGINEWTIARAAQFLTSECSCQVKALNPGLDVLMSVKWNDKIEQISRDAMQGPVGAAGFIQRMEQAEEKLQEKSQ